METINSDLNKLYNIIEAKSNSLLEKSIKDLNNEFDLLTFYNKLVREDIKATILSEYLTQISQFINDLLINLVSYTIELAVVNDSEKVNRVKLNIIRDNSTGSYSLSAYEDFVLNLISKIVLNIFSSNSTATFLILDECLECIDHKNRDKIETLFNNLKTKYKHILLITHISEYYDICNKKINVDNGRFSIV